MKSYAVGVDLGGTYIKAALVERGKGLISEKSIATEGGGGPRHVIDRIASLVKELQDILSGHSISGIGIGPPGAINWERTTVIYPPNLPGWEVVNLRDELRQRLGKELHVFVENDANLAGLGSAHYGAGSPFDSFIMVTLGTGVGGAIIYNNKIFRGTTGAAGEIGHMSIDYEGTPDRYGISGAIEAYIGQRFLSHYARHRLLAYSESLVHQHAGEDLIDLTPKMLYEAAEAGDALAEEVLVWAGHKLGYVLGSAINLLDIRKVVVGGGLSGAGKYIFPATKKALMRQVMPGLRDGVDIIQETLGNEVAMLGAAHLVFQLLDENDLASEKK